MNKLSTVDNLSISENNLISFEGLDALNYITHELDIYSNASLTSLSGLNNLIGVETITLENNDALTSLSGLDNFTKVRHFTIIDNDVLVSFDALNENILFFSGGNSYIRIRNNNNLINLNGLENIYYDYDISITDNPKLLDFCAIPKVRYYKYYAWGNAYNPSQQDILDGNCMP